MNAAITKFFSQRLPREPSEVIALGTAMSVFSMAAGLGLGTLISLVAGPWIAWPLAPLAATIGCMLLAGLEMALAGFHHEAGGVGGEFDR